MGTVVIIFLMSPGLPKVLDIIAPLNESRPHVFPYETEYFVDQNDYYIYIIIHAYLTVPASVGLVVLFNTVISTWVHHASGMLGLILLTIQFHDNLSF